MIGFFVYIPRATDPAHNSRKQITGKGDDALKLTDFILSNCRTLSAKNPRVKAETTADGRKYRVDARYHETSYGVVTIYGVYDVTDERPVTSPRFEGTRWFTPLSAYSCISEHYDHFEKMVMEHFADTECDHKSRKKAA